mmetsp:Transcript_60629/g.195314  ORF Transcript_60629/g.195314 Transcript_60629/m.195314 type:complete len:322 (-) Transcript_60629:1048-2013(-)
MTSARVTPRRDAWQARQEAEPPLSTAPTSAAAVCASSAGASAPASPRAAASASGLAAARAQRGRPILQPMAKVRDATSSKSRAPRLSPLPLTFVAAAARYTAWTALTLPRMPPKLSPVFTGSPTNAWSAHQARAIATRARQASNSNGSCVARRPDAGASNFSGGDQAAWLPARLRALRCRPPRGHAATTLPWANAGRPGGRLRARGRTLARDPGRAACDARAFAHKIPCTTSGAMLPPGRCHAAAPPACEAWSLARNLAAARCSAARSWSSSTSLNEASKPSLPPVEATEGPLMAAAAELVRRNSSARCIHKTANARGSGA